MATASVLIAGLCTVAARGATSTTAPAQAAPVYQGVHGAYQGVQGAYARVPTGTRVPGARIPGASQAPNAVYDEHGKLIGADPDPNVRLQLQKDNDSIQ